MRSRGPLSANARKDPEGQSSSSVAMQSSSASLPVSASASSGTKLQKQQQQQRKFALPGTAKPKRPLEFRPSLRRKNNNSNSGGDSSEYVSSSSDSSSSSSLSSILPLVVAVLLWYSLGVVSISSSKVLLTPYQGSSGIGNDDDENDDNPYTNLDDDYEEHAIYEHVGGLPPLFLTVQQLLLGSTFLRLAIHFRFLGLTKGLVSLDDLLESFKQGSGRRRTSIAASINNTNSSSNPVPRYLVNTGIFFALGFLTTNMAFGAASPTYVETLKAAEPITSAVFAVLWGIEVLTFGEVVGLIGIVGGVLLSTTGSNHSASMAKGAGSSLVVATMIVMASNLCFSLRGLYQKLFRKGAVVAIGEAAASTETATNNNDNDNNNNKDKALDDLNLQFRMQQTGVALLVIPTVVWNGPGLVRHCLGAAATLSTPLFLKTLKHYLLWSIGNGLAFSSYNLASTYLLTRISVVHHAALNCTRRIFAIICTGLLFRIPVSFKSAVGIGISFVGFMVFTKAKAIKQKQQQQKRKKRARTKTKRDVPIGNGEQGEPPLATTLITTVAPNQQSGPAGTTASSYEAVQMDMATRTPIGSKPGNNDFGTHRRATATKNASANKRKTANPTRFPLPPGNNRTVKSPFPPPPPPPPPPPGAPPRRF